MSEDFDELPEEFLRETLEAPLDPRSAAQAQVEGLAIVTADRRFLDYDVAVIDAGT